MNDTELNYGPLFSRCSVGKNRWFWVIYRDFDATCDTDVDDSGFAISAEEAERQARAAIHLKYGQVAVRQYPASYASGVHHREAIKRRAARRSPTMDTKEVEYLYTDWESDYDGHHGSTKHRIVKKTAKRVYVARYSVGSCNEDNKWEENGQVFHDIETVVLDRHKLETEGYASNRRCWSYFYTTPWEERHRPATPRCLELLGLEGGATAETIKAAYRRLAKECHPDHGGNAADFKELQVAYEAAMGRVT